MRILADECVYQLTVNILKKWGIEVITAQEAGLAGFKNGDVLSYALRNKYVFLTRDKDFSDIRIYPPSCYYGIIVIKITPDNQDEVHNILHNFLLSKTEIELCSKLTIIDRNKYRMIT